MENYLIDLDGTVCEDIPNEESHRYPYAHVLKGAVKKVRELYDSGNRITFFTSRESKDREVTLAWLIRHGFKFHGLIMDKPRGGQYTWIDNLDVKGIKFRGDWENVLGERKMRTFWAIVICGILSAAATIGGFMYLAHHSRPQAETVTNEFNVSPTRMANDLINYSVSVPPLGQIWAFAPEQKISVDVLQKKSNQDGMIIAVKMSATATVQPPADAKSKTPPAPVTLFLNGVAKLHYEWIAGEWYLTDIQSVSLHITQK